MGSARPWDLINRLLERDKKRRLPFFCDYLETTRIRLPDVGAFIGGGGAIGVVTFVALSRLSTSLRLDCSVSQVSSLDCQ